MSRFVYQENRSNSYTKHIIEWKHPSSLRLNIMYYNLLGHLRNVVFENKIPVFSFLLFFVFIF